MSIEIERKFLIDPTKLDLSLMKRDPSHKLEIKQSYIVNQPDVSVRVRITSNPDLDDLFYQRPVYPEICVKVGTGAVRMEFEQKIPYEEALALLEKYPTVHKIRYILHIGDTDRYWEIDQFFGEHEGLWLAEIELDSLDEQIDLPNWICEEVTWNAEYYNSNLAK